MQRLVPGYYLLAVKHRLLSVEGIQDAQVEMVWEPHWTPDRISPEGRKTLGIAQED